MAKIKRSQGCRDVTGELELGVGGDPNPSPRLPPQEENSGNWCLRRRRLIEAYQTGAKYEYINPNCILMRAHNRCELTLARLFVASLGFIKTIVGADGRKSLLHGLQENLSPLGVSRRP